MVRNALPIPWKHPRLSRAVAAGPVRSPIPPANSGLQGAVPVGLAGSVHGAHLREQAREDPLDQRLSRRRPTLPPCQKPVLQGVHRTMTTSSDLIDLAEEKRRLRKRMRALRLVADQKEGPDAGLAIIRQALPFLDDLGLLPGRIVAGYWPIITEIDIRPLLARLEARGVICALPAMAAGRDVLVFRRWRLTDDLEEAPLDTRQPPASAPEVIPDALFVPLLAVDAAGHRLGQGKGWYDRTLAALRSDHRPSVIGVCFHVQLLARVPAGPDDQPMDWILTPESLGRARPGRVQP
jgi:5-formyltetrahydrofolate cyclo-ligase